jgi:hypothetical protein
MNNYIPSLIRTWVPVLIGSVAAWLFAKFGLVIDEDSKAQATAGFVAFVIGAYYAVVRYLETKYPLVGWLLGMPKQPGYAPGMPPPSEPPPVPNE